MTQATQPNEYVSFKEKLAKFVSRKAAYLNTSNPVELYSKKIDETICGVTPPIEIDMEINEEARSEYFFMSVKPGDYVIGYLSSFHNTGVTATLISMDDYGRARDLYNLNIKAFCPVFELKKYYQNENPMDAYSLKDRIRGIVTYVEASSKNIVMSFNNPDTESNITLGLIEDDDVPYNYKCSKNSQRYSDQLVGSASFKNPLNIAYLSQHFKLSDHNGHSSFMEGLKGVCYSEDSFASALRQSQINRLAIISVSKGVACVKKGNLVDAMTHLNKAIEIDSENVEALVARGALRANTESYAIAIEDFRYGLSINPNHRNGKRYLIETLVAYAKKLAANQEYATAVMKLQDVLKLEPQSEEANYLLGRLNKFMEQKIVKAAEDWDDHNSGPDQPENKDEEKFKKNKKTKKSKKHKSKYEEDQPKSNKRRRSSKSSSRSISRHSPRNHRELSRSRSRSPSAASTCSPGRGRHRSSRQRLDEDASPQTHRRSRRHSPKGHRSSSRSRSHRRTHSHRYSRTPESKSARRYDSSRSRNRNCSDNEEDVDNKSTRVVVIIDKDKKDLEKASKKQTLKKTLLDIHDKNKYQDSFEERSPRSSSKSYRPFTINPRGGATNTSPGMRGYSGYQGTQGRGQWRPVMDHGPPRGGRGGHWRGRGDGGMEHRGSPVRFDGFRGRGGRGGWVDRGRSRGNFRGYNRGGGYGSGDDGSPRGGAMRFRGHGGGRGGGRYRNEPGKLKEMEEFLSMLKTKKSDHCNR